ncbi:hypothetical protein OIU84_020948 [Salix udensis]|uniref:Uncharacterized protein n=1 Tax=Salix udensis TaxID=889485 RepID=A0AAD6KTY4_9ROSI|nr:hypothetical protein OIU84_020948 [Salix udensis]
MVIKPQSAHPRTQQGNPNKRVAERKRDCPERKREGKKTKHRRKYPSRFGFGRILVTGPILSRAISIEGIVNCTGENRPAFPSTCDNNRRWQEIEERRELVF